MEGVVSGSAGWVTGISSVTGAAVSVISGRIVSAVGAVLEQPDKSIAKHRKANRNCFTEHHQQEA
jgi:hypothetical protein